MRMRNTDVIFGVVFALLSAACGPDAPPASPPSEAPDATQDVEHSEAVFEEVAADVGLDFTHWNGMTGRYYYGEMIGSGVALFDYDRDGDLDVYLVQGNLLGTEDTVADAVFPPPGELPLRDRLFRNDLGEGGDLRFTDVTEVSGLVAEGYGMGAAAADFDNDGWIDLYVLNYGPNQLFRNHRGTFEDVTDAKTADGPHWSTAAAILDADGDGLLDIYLGNYVVFSPATNPQCTDELGTANYCGPLSFAPEPDTLLRNRGGLTFEDVSRSAGIRSEFGGTLGAVAADLDLDGRPDIYVGNDGLPNQLWMSTGRDAALAFENRALLAGCAVNDQGQPEASMGMNAADFDNDGDDDLFIAHLTRETNTLYVNDGRGLFTDRSNDSGLGAPSLSMTGFGTAVFDYDNDGWQDVLVVNGAVKVIKEQALAGDPLPLRQRNLLFRNRRREAAGRITFEDVTGEAGPAFDLLEVSRGAAFGDLDNDGDVDVVVSNNNGAVRLLRNRIGQDRPWIGLRIVGRPGVDGIGERDMIGARVRVDLPGQTLYRRVSTAGGYASSSDPRLVIGLGDPRQVERVRVTWPDGSEEEWTELPIGRYSVLRQGEGAPMEER